MPTNWAMRTNCTCKPSCALVPREDLPVEPTSNAQARTTPDKIVLCGAPFSEIVQVRTGFTESDTLSSRDAATFLRDRLRDAGRIRAGGDDVQSRGRRPVDGTADRPPLQHRAAAAFRCRRRPR